MTSLLQLSEIIFSYGETMNTFKVIYAYQGEAGFLGEWATEKEAYDAVDRAVEDQALRRHHHSVYLITPGGTRVEIDLAKIKKPTIVHVMITGVHGCGKSTIAHFLARKLRGLGVNIKITDSYGDDAEKIRFSENDVYLLQNFSAMAKKNLLVDIETKTTNVGPKQG